MENPVQLAPVSLEDGIVTFPAFAPLPGLGLLPANSFLIDGEEPVLIDTGLPPLANDLVRLVDECVGLNSLKWIWLTHMDPDHLGALRLVLDGAPQARIVTSYLGAAKLGLLGYAADRVHLIEPGDTLDAGGRELVAIRPPYFDAAETLGLWDRRSRSYFCADAFGGLMNRPASTAEELTDQEYRDGLLAWLRIDNPWLAEIAPAHFAANLQRYRQLGASALHSSHMPLAGPDHSRLFETVLEVQATLASAAERQAA